MVDSPNPSAKKNFTDIPRDIENEHFQLATAECVSCLAECARMKLNLSHTQLDDKGIIDWAEEMRVSSEYEPGLFILNATSLILSGYKGEHRDTAQRLMNRVNRVIDPLTDSLLIGDYTQVTTNPDELLRLIVETEPVVRAIIVSFEPSERQSLERILELSELHSERFRSSICAEVASNRALVNQLRDFLGLPAVEN